MGVDLHTLLYPTQDVYSHVHQNSAGRGRAGNCQPVIMTSNVSTIYTL